MKNLIRILLYLLLVLLVVAIAVMIYKRSKTPTDDVPPTSEMTDSLFMDPQNQTAITSEDSMIMDLTGQLPDKVGAPAEARPASGNTVEAQKPANGAVDYSQPVAAAEPSAAVNTNPKAQKVSDKVAPKKMETAPATNTKTAVVKTNTASTKATESKASSSPKAETKKKVEAKSTKTSASNSAGFYVVSGSFIVPAHADEQVAKLKKMGYKGAMKKVFGSSEYYSAVVGQYASRQEADKIVSKLNAKGEKAFLKAK